MIDAYMNSLVSHVRELVDMASTETAYVSKPLLGHVKRWLEPDDGLKGSEIDALKTKLLDGLDVDFSGTQWEAERLAGGKICKCKACGTAAIRSFERYRFPGRRRDRRMARQPSGRQM